MCACVVRSVESEHGNGQRAMSRGMKDNVLSNLGVGAPRLTSTCSPPYSGWYPEPFMSWILYSTIAAAALAAADVFVKLAAGRLPNSLATLLYGGVAFAIGLSWYVADRLRGETERASTAGLVYAISVGASFSIVAVALYGAFRAGAPLSITAPVVRISGVLVASVFGVLLWSEPVTTRYVTGVCLAMLGVYLIVTR
jgi:uncharacterized membrane protein